MAKEIKNLAIVNPIANIETTAFHQGGSPGLYLVSVIVSNNALDDARFDITVFNNSASTNNAYVAKGQLISGRNSYETHRFTLDYYDNIHIKSTSSSVSFLISGVNQTE